MQSAEQVVVGGIFHPVTLRPWVPLDLHLLFHLRCDVVQAVLRICPVHRAQER